MGTETSNMNVPFENFLKFLRTKTLKHMQNILNGENNLNKKKCFDCFELMYRKTLICMQSIPYGVTKIYYEKRVI